MRKLSDYVKSKNTKNLKLRLKLIYGWVLYGIRYWEFVGMHLEKKKFKQINDFVPRWEEEDLYFQVNPRKYVNLLENKYQCYKYFQKYYHRKVLYVSVSDKLKNQQLVREFLNTTDGVIFKPIDAYCGKGIEVVKQTEGLNIEDYFKKFTGDFIIEELIKQDRRMASFHQESVNSIRIFTINYGNEIEIKWPFFRIGCGDSCVDNMGKGGIGIAVDELTGITLRAGDEKGSVYDKHPDTGMDLIGFQIPEWDSLCNIVKEMACLCPDCHVMGWDMALTDNGWCMIECNYGPGIAYQYAYREGVRKDFNIIRKRLGARKGKSIGSCFLSPYLQKPC